MININYRRFLGCLSTNLVTLLLIQIHFATNIFLTTKAIWEREKREMISYLSAWGCDRRLCLKILPSRKNEIYLWKMVVKVGMYSATHENVTLPLGRGALWEKIKTNIGWGLCDIQNNLERKKSGTDNLCKNIQIGK